MSWRRLLLAAKNSKYIFPGHKDLLVLIQGFSDLINYASVVIYKQRCNLACLSVFLSEQCCGIFRSLLIGCCGCFTVFDSVVAYKKYSENVTILVISWQKVISSTHGLKFLTGTLLTFHSLLIRKVMFSKKYLIMILIYVHDAYKNIHTWLTKYSWICGSGCGNKIVT